MYSVQINVGRLAEGRIATPFMAADLQPLQALLRRVLGGAPGRVVFCVDFRDASVFTQDVVAGLVDAMRGDNPHIERSGFILGGGAVFAMQAERMIRAAGNPERRVF